MTLSNRQFSKLSGKTRLCSAGHKYFFILSNGSVSRCAAHKYNFCEYIGNILDPSFQDRILQGISKKYLCDRSICIPDCDGRLTVQNFTNGVEHVGEGLELAGSKDSCAIQVHLTHACNYECPYCIADGWMTKFRREDLNNQQWMEVVDFFSSHFETGVCILLGGEPLLSTSFIPFADALLQKGWRVDVITNFTFPDKIRQLCEKNRDAVQKNFHVCISLHPINRGFDFDKIRRDIESLHDEFGIGFNFAVVKTELNEAIIDRMGILKQIKDMGTHICLQEYGGSKEL